MKKEATGIQEALGYIRKANEILIKEAEKAEGEELKVLESIAFSLEKADAELSDF